MIIPALGGYLPGDTPLHRLDPRVKIIGMLVLSLIIFDATGLRILLLTSFFAVLIVASRISLHQVAMSLRPVMPFMLLLFGVHLFFTDGTPLFPFLPRWMGLTQQGAEAGAYVIWQFACLVTAAMLLTMTTSPSELVGGIERLLGPFHRIGIRPSEIALMISIALRFFPLVLEEYELIREAHLSRGADFSSGGLRRRLRAAAALTMPLLLGALRRGDELTSAIEARGYRRAARTSLREFKFRYPDAIAMVVIAFLVVADFLISLLP